MKKLFSGILVALLLFVQIPLFANAAEQPPVDFSKTGSITVYKYSFGELDPSENSREGTGVEIDPTHPDYEFITNLETIEGAVFEIQQTHELVQKTDGTEEFVELTTPAAPVQGTTLVDGTFTFEDLPLGRYTLKEVSAPGHLIDTETYVVDVPLTITDGTELLYDVHVYPKNIPALGGVQFTKIGEDADANALAGVVFHLFDENDNRLDNVDYTSNASGIVQVTGLEPGNYYFQEVETVDGYLLNNTKIEFTIEEVLDDQQPEEISLPDFTNYKQPEVEKEQRDLNDPWGDQTTTLVGETVDFRLSATAPTDIADYITFGLYDEIDPRLTYVGLNEVYIKDANEEVIELDAADYTFVEPADNSNRLTVLLTEQGLGKLQAGSQFIVEFSAVVNETAIEQGQIPNTATVVYDNNKGDEGEKESTPTITDPLEGSLNIKKVDKTDNNKVLEGAVFKLQKKDENDAWVDVADGERTTDTAGEAAWNPLVSGDYRLIETKAPAGYNLLANPIEFTINDQNITKSFVVENVPEGFIPQTGGMGTLLFTVFGIILMAIAGVGFVNSRRKQANR